MRRQDRELTDRAEIDAIIRGSQVCRLAMADGDSPYLVPLSFGYDGTAIYFHTAQTGRKIEFIERNNRVCFEFEHQVELVADSPSACKWTFAFESVIGFGTVRELHGIDEKIHGLQQITRQYAEIEAIIDEQTAGNTRVWRIEIQSMTGKRSAPKQ